MTAGTYDLHVLAEQRHLLVHMLEQFVFLCPIPVCMCDKNGHILLYSQSWADALNLHNYGDITGFKVCELLPFKKEEVIQANSCAMKSLDGHRIACGETEMSLIPVFSRQNEVCGVLYHLREVKKSHASTERSIDSTESAVKH